MERRGSSLVSRPCFLEMIVLLASSDHALQRAPGWFVSTCDAAEMRIGSSEFEDMVLSQKLEECLPWVGDQTLPQMEEVKYPW